MHLTHHIHLQAPWQEKASEGKVGRMGADIMEMAKNKNAQMDKCPNAQIDNWTSGQMDK